jgi:Type VI secretion system (T6SS), amidase effector protein 4
MLVARMKFPTPYFDILVREFRHDPRAAHICVKGFHSGEPTHPDTSGTRMSEALCLANGLLRDRAALMDLAERGDGRDVMLGRFGFLADLCSHGMARSAKDLAYFLVDHWGRPQEMLQPKEEEATTLLTELQGVIAFIGLYDETSAGHIDIWDKTECKGAAFWNCRKAYFWKLA